MTDRCPFCEIAAGVAWAWRIDENPGAIAFLDVNPASEGHTLVIPRNHARDIWELNEPDAAAVWELTRLVAQRVRSTFAPAGLTILQSNGEAAWQHVFHVHVHVVPRWTDDGLRKPWNMIPEDPDRLERVAERLRQA